MHPDLYGRSLDQFAALAVPRALGLLELLDLELVLRALEEARGVPVPVGTFPAPTSAPAPISTPTS